MSNFVETIDKEKVSESIKFFVWTIFVGEVFFVLLDFVVTRFFNSEQIVLRISVIVLMFLLPLTIKVPRYLSNLKKSKREYTLVPILVGIITIIFIHAGYFIDLYKYISKHFSFDYFIYFIVWVSFFVSILLRLENKKVKDVDKEIFFLSDNPIEKEVEDKLGFREDARVYAKNVFDKTNKDNSMVFGLNSPWGSGKSSYINLCRDFWERQEPKPIIFNFQPLIYENQNALLDKFSKDFLGKINEEINSPKLRKSMRRYIGKIMDYRLNFLGLVEMTFKNDSSYEKLLRDLETELRKLDRKIIIIIDDLDRLELSEIKSMLNLVKSSFSLPNVNFMLCYSTENISLFGSVLKKRHTNYYFDENNKEERSVAPFSHGDNKNTKKLPDYSLETEVLDNKNIVQYFEKIVQVEKILIPKKKKLLQFFETEIKKIINPSKHSSESVDEIKSGFYYFFLPENYPNYHKYICDIRKIKRIINFVIEKDLLSFNGARRSVDKNKIGFDRVDINFLELLKLVILHINYPHIFNKIYLCETDDCMGSFSAVDEFTDKEELGFKNSDFFHKFIKTLTPEECFLVKDLFDVGEKTDELKPKINDAKFRSSTILFNGSGFLNPNLREYLEFIVDKKKPKLANQHKNHFAEAKKIIDNKGTAVEDDLNEHSEYAREKIFNSILNILETEIEKIDYETADRLIDYATRTITDYSLFDDFKNGHNGLRVRFIIYFIVKLLNDKGWKDDNDESKKNTAENLIAIANRIFGEKEFKDNGILEIITKEKGILGIRDMLLFRSYCTQDGSETFFNVHSSLIYHHERFKAKTDGLVNALRIDQMRELSQKCFKIFKKNYIEKSINIFEEIQKLQIDDLSGKFKSEIEKEYKGEKEVSFSDDVERAKNSVAGFIVYQLTNTGNDNSIGCGYYNVEGVETEKNKRGIGKEMIKYLFNTCFNVENDNQKNAKIFVNYLLTSLSIVNSIKKSSAEPRIKEFSRLLDEGELRAYWNKNKDEIMSYMREQEVRTQIHTYNYSITYEEKLEDLFQALDKLIECDKKNKSDSQKNNISSKKTKWSIKD